MELETKDIKRVEIDGEIFDMGYIKMKSGEVYYFSIISEKEFNNRIEQERRMNHR